MVPQPSRTPRGFRAAEALRARSRSRSSRAPKPARPAADLTSKPCACRRASSSWRAATPQPLLLVQELLALLRDSSAEFDRAIDSFSSRSRRWRCNRPAGACGRDARDLGKMGGRARPPVICARSSRLALGVLRSCALFGLGVRAGGSGAAPRAATCANAVILTHERFVRGVVLAARYPAVARPCRPDIVRQRPARSDRAAAAAARQAAAGSRRARVGARAIWLARVVCASRARSHLAARDSSRAAASRRDISALLGGESAPSCRPSRPDSSPTPGSTITSS